MAEDTARRGRIDSLDMLRGVAVAGILLMNIWSMGSVPGIERNPALAPGWGLADQAVWWFGMVFVEGAMRGLFCLLFGAGFMLMAGRVSAWVWYRRTLLLIGLGLVHGYLLLWPGDILLVYGLCGLVLWLARDMEARPMAGLGIACLVLLTGLTLGNLVGLANKQAFAEAAIAAGVPEEDARVSAWRTVEASVRPDPELIERSRTARAGGIEANLIYKSEVADQLNDLGYSRVWLLDALGIMLIGAAMMKWGLFGADADRGIWRWMMIAGYGVGIPVGLAEWGQLYAGGFTTPIQLLSVTDQIGRSAMTCGHLGALLLLWHGNGKPVQGTGGARRILSVFVPAGRMALTNYIGQTIICQWVLFPGFGLGLHAKLSHAQLWLAAAAIIAVQLTLSVLWLRRFRQGPLEYLWRRGTYLRRP
nr:DUF418 domain-containing protein [Pacificimonas pallii]